MTKLLITISLLLSFKTLAGQTVELKIDRLPSPLASIDSIQKTNEADLIKYLSQVKKKLKKLPKNIQKEALNLEVKIPKCESAKKQSCNLVFSSVLKCAKKKRACPVDINTEPVFHQSPYARTIWMAHWQNLRTNISNLCRTNQKILKTCTALTKIDLPIK